MPTLGAHTSVRFFGPDSTRQIRAVDSSGFEIARFMISGDPKAFTISRLVSPATAPFQICTGTHSSLSGTTKLMVHGAAQVRLRNELVFTLDTPMLGKLTWASDSMFSSRNMKLQDKGKNVIARGTTKGELEMEVLVRGDELLLDCLLAGWVALIYSLNKTREINSVGLEVVGALAGA